MWWASRCGSGSTTRLRTPSARAARRRRSLRARESCHALGIPHVTLDGRGAFRRTVVEPFVAGYARGETPNPCTTCNGSYRLAALVDAAERLGAPRVATGHYARLVERDGRTLVARGADEAKDQSYMLARVPSEVLARLRLPLGDATQGRRASRGRRGGHGGRHRAREPGRLLPRRRRARRLPRPRGRAARHGQHSRRGRARAGAPHGRGGLHAGPAARPRSLGRGAALCPALGRRPQRARGRPQEPARAQRGVPCAMPASTAGCGRVHAKLRSRSPTVAARVEQAPEGVLLRLEEPVYGVAPGQTAVLYDDGGCVVGSGVIAPG